MPRHPCRAACVQAMTALLDQQLLRRTRSTSLAGAQGAIPTWVDLCAEALPNGFDPLFTCQQVCFACVPIAIE